MAGKNYGDTVYAGECLSCGVTFDFRAKDGITHGACPTCGESWPIRDYWPADDGGYHVSREVILNLVRLWQGDIKRMTERHLQELALIDKARRA